MPIDTTEALKLMTKMDVRRRGDSLQCPHPKPPMGQPRTVVMLWDRDRRLPLTGHPDYSRGFLCDACGVLYKQILG